MTLEAWKAITDWPQYEVSDHGRVRRDGRILKWRMCGRKHEQYPRVALCHEGKRVDPQVHHLVAYHFIGPRPDGMQINHKDRNRNNAHVANLEYVTPSRNVQHTYETGRHGLIGCRNPSAVLDAEKVCVIRQRYASGVTQTALSREFGVTQPTISSIVLRRIWKEVQ